MKNEIKITRVTADVNALCADPMQPADNKAICFAIKCEFVSSFGY